MISECLADLLRIRIATDNAELAARMSRTVALRDDRVVPV
jgi:hypothetical protein